MLDMGFINDVKRNRQAATHPNRQHRAVLGHHARGDRAALAKSLLKNPVRVEGRPSGHHRARRLLESSLSHRACAHQAEARLPFSFAQPGRNGTRHCLHPHQTWRGCCCAPRTWRATASRPAVIHGNKSQNARQKRAERVQVGEKVRILVATDIAARGIDVQNITHVINFELPDDTDSYVHRIGRTARNGAEGIAITLIEPGEADKLRAVEKLIRHKIPEAAKPAFVVKPRTEQDRKDDAAADRKPFGHRGQSRPNSRPAGRSGTPRSDGKPAPKSAPFQARRREEGEIEPVKLHPAFAPTKADAAKAGPEKKKRRFRPNRAKSRAA
jgi:ATP-dependent RNA helicase RhlE